MRRGLSVLVTGTEINELTLEMTEALKSADKIILHTEKCGCAEWLRQNGTGFSSLDHLYESCEDFDEHARLAAEEVTALSGNVCYCVLNERDESIREVFRLRPSAGLIGTLAARANAPVVTLSALDALSIPVSPEMSVYVTEIDNRVTASDLKLRLMDIYGDDAKAYVRHPDGGEGRIPLENLDRLKSYDHRSCCLVNPTGIHADFEALMKKGREELYENNDIDAEVLAKRLADVVRCISAGEACGDFTVQDVLDKTLDILNDKFMEEN